VTLRRYAVRVSVTPPAEDRSDPTERNSNMADMTDLMALVEKQGKDWTEFQQKNDDRLKAIEQENLELGKKMNRPGIGNEPRMDGADLPEPEGYVTLSAADLKSRDTIAAKLKIEQDADNPVRIGDFVRAAAGMQTERKGLIEGTDPSGGYTVPRVLMPGIMAALAPASSLLSAGANVVALDQPADQFTVAGISTIPTAQWRGERGNVAESDPAFRAIVLYPKSLAFFFKVSRELLMDAPGLDAALNNVIGQAFAKAIDKAGLFGQGASNEPLGLVNTANINTVDLGTNGTALASYTPLVSAMTAIESKDAPSPNAAIMAPRTYGDFAGLTDTTGQPLRRPEALASWKFQRTSQVPIDDTVGTNDDCSRVVVGDFSNFSFYMREAMSVQLLREKYADTGEIGFVAHARVDQAAFYPQAFCVVKGVRPASAT
jgi:HK97 family phage major capsid protein